MTHISALLARIEGEPSGLTIFLTLVATCLFAFFAVG